MFDSCVYYLKVKSQVTNFYKHGRNVYTYLHYLYFGNYYLIKLINNYILWCRIVFKLIPSHGQIIGDHKFSKMR